MYTIIFSCVAQWIRRLATDQKIGGSTPPVGEVFFGLLSQMSMLGVPFLCKRLASDHLLVCLHLGCTQLA